MPAHPTAIVDETADVHPSATVGPYAIVHAGVIVGPACVIGPYSVLHPGTTLGARNVLHAHVSIGDLPQSVGFDPHVSSTVVVGDDNRLRECTSVHRSEREGGTTVLGNHGYYMVHSHVGHDCRVGDHAILAAGALLGGHVHLDDRVFLSGNVLVHQFCRIGRLAFLRGAAAATLDVPPFAMVDGTNQLRGMNVVGLRRAGCGAASRSALARAYKTLFYRDLNLTQALAALEEEPPDPLVAELVAFIRSSERGIVRAHARGPRAGAPESDAAVEP